MARINIEDSIFKDSRFIKLCIKIGDQQTALGVLVWAYIIAQKFYLDESNDRLIPLLEWKRNECNDFLIEVGLVEKRDNGFYVHGSENQFKWLVQRSNAGKIGGGSNRIKQQKKATVDERKATVEQPLSLSLSLSPSPSLSLSSHSTSISKKKKKVPVAAASPSALAPEKTLGSKIFEAYSQAYKKRHGAEPVRDRMANSLCKAIGEALGEEGVEVAEFYVSHNKAFYVQAYHPLNLLKQDASALRTQWATGKMMTTTQARSVENKQQIINAFAKHLKNEDVT